MLDIDLDKLLLVALIALVVIGPKDLPRAMLVCGQWLSRARAMTRHFRAGFDTMIRDAELDEPQRPAAVESGTMSTPPHGSSLLNTRADTDPIVGAEK
jgi:sec-independent protein translocase protein TatB